MFVVATVLAPVFAVPLGVKSLQTPALLLKRFALSSDSVIELPAAECSASIYVNVSVPDGLVV